MPFSWRRRAALGINGPKAHQAHEANDAASGDTDASRLEHALYRARSACWEDKWGRIGFGVLKGWRPGMFIGVLHDGGDHKVELLDEKTKKTSPDACVILDMHCKQYPEYRNNDHYKELVKRLTEEWPSDGSAAWQAYHHLDTPNPNRWHPLHIRQKLADILLDGKSGEEKSGEEQVDAFFEDHYKELVKRLTEGRGRPIITWKNWRIFFLTGSLVKRSLVKNRSMRSLRRSRKWWNLSWVWKNSGNSGKTMPGKTMPMESECPRRRRQRWFGLIGQILAAFKVYCCDLAPPHQGEFFPPIPDCRVRP